MAWYLDATDVLLLILRGFIVAIVVLMILAALVER